MSINLQCEILVDTQLSCARSARSKRATAVINQVLRPRQPRLSLPYHCPELQSRLLPPASDHHSDHPGLKTPSQRIWVEGAHAVVKAGDEIG
ncbi:hypothetical protein CVT26_012470 [Gymnopilus dilepis]|uniref:Uncharacterized protein n=1 Tax=Gymnopilus dilepis TaxID=231916 RepID=A0A409YCS0_9AGAR|nr:hypothetical protein CVT26_012470 [Gymnopilus dilepis]